MRLSRMRMHACLLRRALTPGAMLISRGSPKFQQTTLGSYPVPPEQELLWKNRMKAYGGYIQQTISPFQMKALWPFWHTFPARYFSTLDCLCIALVHYSRSREMPARGCDAAAPGGGGVELTTKGRTENLGLSDADVQNRIKATLGSS